MIEKILGEDPRWQGKPGVAAVLQRRATAFHLVPTPFMSSYLKLEKRAEGKVRVPQSTVSCEPFRIQVTKWDLNLAVWPQTAHPSYHLMSWWVVLVGCGTEGSAQGPQQLPGNLDQHIAVCCLLPPTPLKSDPPT